MNAVPITAPSNGYERGLSSQRMEGLKEGVSVVVPHGGKERLSNLAATLVNLRQSAGLDEIIVVELGATPCAEIVSRRWADKYIFLRHEGAYVKARSLNAGTMLAECDMVLWCDNDLLVPPEFIRIAASEFRDRHLDFLIPFNLVYYLAPDDSRRVREGTLNPADCKPVRFFRGATEANGGMGLVRRSFVQRYGGIPEDFRGWGGEDDAWKYKANLLGRAGATRRHDQRVYHLFHANSGGYGGIDQVTSNPHYADNLALLRQICSIRDPQVFLQRFPPATNSRPLWPKKRVVFLADPTDSQMDSLASSIADVLRGQFDMTIELRTAPCDESAQLDQISPNSGDAIVIFGFSAAKRLLSKAPFQTITRSTVVAMMTDQDLCENEIDLLRHVEPIWWGDPLGRLRLQAAGLRSWGRRINNKHPITPVSAATELLGPLSMVLGGSEPHHRVESKCPEGKTPSRSIRTTSGVRLPVWMYWEGNCPEWIRHCQQTVSAHAEDVRLLSRDDFEKLRDVDRDIDLERLQPAHRADYIRAFLLARYGGLWVDSDCIVMTALAPVLDHLEYHDFVAHRERSNYVSNGFIASQPGGKIASNLYSRVCRTLRSGKSIGWISLGSEPLTEILASTAMPWFEIECERVQPICWSRPEEYFAVRSTEEHEGLFSRDAICYMLSNVQVCRYQLNDANRDLLRDGTFFRFLLDKSMSKLAHAAETFVRREDSAIIWPQLPFCLSALTDVEAKRGLNLGREDERSCMLLRKLNVVTDATEDADGNHIYIEGILSAVGEIPSDGFRLYDRFHGRLNGDQFPALRVDGDLIRIADAIEGLPKKYAKEVLQNALDAADYVLVDFPAAPKQGRIDAHRRLVWSLPEVLAMDPIRYLTYSTDSGGAIKYYVACLLSRADPHSLRLTSPIEQLFTQFVEQYRQWRDESISGPGSSISNTTEIRRLLPLMIEDLGIRTILDAPCGDLNWMNSIELGVEEYIGVDVMRPLIARNRREFGGQNRKFLALDIMRDSLPWADLILCRDCLPHFSYEDIQRVLRNFWNTGSKYLLTTTFVRVNANVDVTTGGWRPLNLQLPPIGFPRPLRIINEKCREMNGKYADKSLGLWCMGDLL